MNQLWSPWRMEYIQSHKEEGCVFCLEAAKPDGLENLILYRANRSFIILNRFPYTSGHLMIVPFDHKPSIELLESETLTEIMDLCVYSMRVLQAAYTPQGFNVGINIGEAAGAGIIEHVHLHVVPRWRGDTNFMSSLSGVRVLPEALEVTYERIKLAWESGRKA